MTGWFPLFSAAIGGTSAAAWRILPIGAGGFNTGASIANDGTLMLRTDTYGAYRWDPAGTSPIGTTGTWTQLITALSMPSDYVNGSILAASIGCYEIQMCYGTSNVVYMMFADVNAANTNTATVFKSTNTGSTWTRTGFTPIPGGDSGNAPPNDGPWKGHGPKICINPSDSTKLYVGTQGAGLWLSTNGGTSFSQVSTGSIPNPIINTQATAGGYSGMVWSRSNTSNIYISSNGNGVYFSGNGGSTWSKLTTGTGPVDVYWADIDENNGNYWAMENATNKLWKWNGATWSTPYTGSINGFAIDPTTANHVVVASSDTLFESTNGTSFGTGSSTGTYTGDIGWMYNVPGIGGTGPHFTGNPMLWDRSGSKTIYSFSNLGPFVITWTGSISNTTNPAFEIRGRGVEQQVGLEVVVPPGGSPVACVWDNGVFYKPSTGFATSFPSILRPSNAFGTQTAAWSCDYAFGTPTFLVMVGDGDYEQGVSQAWTSSNGGSTWSSIQSTMPISQSNGACVAVSTTTNFIVGDGNTRQPWYTSNGGTSWTAITLPGSPSWGGFGGFTGRGKWMVADRVNSGNFALLFVGQGFYTSTNGGVTFTGPFGTGVIDPVNGGDSIMKAVPGQAGHAFYCNPNPSGTGGSGSGVFYYTTNMYAGAGQTWTQMTNIGIAHSFGFGAPAAGTTYPAIFFSGYTSFPCSNGVSIGLGTKTFNVTGSPGYTVLSGSPVWMQSDGNGAMRGSVVSYVAGVLTVTIDTILSGSGGPFSNWKARIYGTWQATGNSVPGATPIWVQIGIFPNNNLDTCQGISGDPNIVGRVYYSTGGSSFLYYG